MAATAAAAAATIMSKQFSWILLLNNDNGTVSERVGEEWFDSKSLCEEDTMDIGDYSDCDYEIRFVEREKPVQVPKQYRWTLVFIHGGKETGRHHSDVWFDSMAVCRKDSEEYEFTFCCGFYFEFEERDKENVASASGVEV
jgi:hypothetical protein